MELPKCVGFSFGLDELFSSAKKHFEDEERNRSMFGLGSGSGSSSVSKTPVKDAERGSSASQSSFSALNFVANRIRQGNVVGFSALHGSSSGTAEGFKGSKKEGVALRNFNVNVGGNFGGSDEKKKEAFSRGYDNTKLHQKKGTCKKPILKGDPDWLPEKGKRLPNSVCKRQRPIHCQDRKNSLMEDEGMGVSEPRVQNMASPNGLKNLLLSSGWRIVSQKGSCDPAYVSPLGSVYGSLQKALEVFSRDACKSREKQCCSSQSVGSSSGNVAKRNHKSEAFQRTRIVPEPITKNIGLPQQKFVEENNKKLPRECTKVQETLPFVENECLDTETKDLDLSNIVVGLVAPNSGNNCVNVIHQGDKFLGAGKLMHVSEKHVLSNRKFDKEINKADGRASKLVPTLKGDTIQKLVNEKGKVKEDLPIPEETRLGKVHEVMAVDKKRKNSIKDECLNHERNNVNRFHPTMTNNDHDSSANMYQNGECQGVRRSARINGRHVPVAGELDMEMWDGDFYFDSFSSGDMLQWEKFPGKEEPDGKPNEKDGSPVLEKKRYREVNELLASCMAEEKAESCNSTDILMQDVLPSKQEPDKRSSKKPSPVPEEMIFSEVHQVMTSCLENEKGMPCSTDDCSYETKKVDWSNEVVVKSDQSGDNKMHQNDDLVGVRRSTRINGRHVPVDNRFDTEMLASAAFMGMFSFVANRVTKENEVTTISSEVDKFTGQSPVTGNMLFKKSPGKKFDCQKARNKKLLESNNISFRHELDSISKRWDEIDTPVSGKCCPSLKRNVAKGVMTEKRSPSRSKRKSIGKRYSNGKKKKERSGGCSLIVRTGQGGLEEDTTFSETKVTILSWLIDSGILTENAEVVYKTKKGQRNTLRGWVTRGGIWCNCCRKVLSSLEFEVHAGSNLRQPWNNTYLSSGKSLMQCQSEAWEKEKQKSNVGFQVVGIGDADPSDDTCGICADGGELLCCDGCTSTFHQECVMLKSLPQGCWHCPFCSCVFCSWDDHEEDKSNGTVNLLSCNHCGCKYHKDCVLETDMDKMGSNSSSYCGKNCKKVAVGLSDLLGISNPIGEGFSWILVRHLDEVDGICSDQMQSFILECNARLPLALLVLHECFIPLVDPRTGLDMTTQAVYNCGSNFNRLNYEGFYTMILEKDDEIISVATLRLRGTRLAEMPFIGTRPTYRRQGMCRRLLNAIEKMLSSLHVKKLIIPATPDMLETWIKSFSFQQLELSHRDEIRNLNMVLFADTTLLQKSIYDEKANIARDKQQLEPVDGFGQDTLNCYNPVYEVANLGQCEELKESTADDDTQYSIVSEFSNGSVFDIFRVHGPTIVKNINLVSQSPETTPPIALTSVDNILTEASVCPEIVSLPNTNLLMSAKC